MERDFLCPKPRTNQSSPLSHINNTSCKTPYTIKEVDEAIARLGTEKPFFSVDDLRLSLNLSQANAYRIAARLEEEGKIKNIGKGRNKLYVLGEHDGK